MAGAKRGRKRQRAGPGAATEATVTLEESFDLAGKLAIAEKRQAYHERRVEELKAQLREEEGQLQAWQKERVAASRDMEVMRASEWSPAWSELPTALWERIAGQLDEEKALFSFAMTCRRFREMQKRVLRSRGKRTMRSEVLAGWSKRLKVHLW